MVVYIYKNSTSIQQLQLATEHPYSCKELLNTLSQKLRNKMAGLDEVQLRPEDDGDFDMADGEYIVTM